MGRGSQHDQDEISWQTVGVPLGRTGLDLRQPSDPGALTELLNARFVDDRTIEQRTCHRGVRLRDAGEYPALGPGYTVTGDWVYGHGAQVSSSNALAWENAHHPHPGQARATFSFDGSDVVWTGDRLLYSNGDAAALGASVFWQRGSSSAPLAWGIPAYLPLQVDSTPPAGVMGDYLETCLTTTLRAYVHSDGESLTAWIVDRVTGAVIDSSEISDVSDAPVDPKVVNSADTVVVLWRDADDNILYMRHWTGVAWTPITTVHADVHAYDVAPVDGGFHLVWREGTPAADKLFAGRYARASAQDSPYTFGTELTGITPGGAVAIGVAPRGDIAVLEGDSALRMRVYNSSLSPLSAWTTLDAASGWTAGLAVCSRGLLEASDTYKWVVHASRASSLGTKIFYVVPVAPGAVLTVNSTATRYNSCLASKSFRVGDEVFCWLRASNSGTHYLVAGVGEIEICGVADREEAIVREMVADNYGIPHVMLDPLDEDGHTLTWIRPYNTGQSYPRGGNVRIGDLSFLPDMTSVAFGRSVYLSGSLVRNYDGTRLGDAGFHDYPIVTADAPAAGAGELTVDAPYFFRVYPVRYNARGERFQGSAVTYGPVELSGAENEVTLTISTIPLTNHDDVVFEVYRTTAGGTTFYLDGTVDNDLTSATVTFTSTRVDFSDPPDDDDLDRQVGDSHSAGLGALSELEEMGPLGCAMLAASGDRLWGAGGQVPAGLVQFSKLKEDEEGAGFDSLAGFQTVDTEGSAVTSVIGFNDVTVIFQRDRLNVVAGTGPDNYGRGAFVIPQIVLADGATSHRGTVLTQLGVLYWGQEGPRLLTTSYQVLNISAPVRPLAETLEPSGVRANLSEHEVIWYTRSGEALLWNYLGDNSRWAEWRGLQVAGCSQGCLVMVDGRLFYPDADAAGDDGRGFPFSFTSGNLRPEQVMAGAAMLRAVGITGRHLGEHRLRFRIYYNGSPLWSEEWIWEPATNTWLVIGEEIEDLTVTAIDALDYNDQSGAYAFHKRTARHQCQFFRVQVSTIESDGPTYTPYELSLELGSRGGHARTPVATVTSTIGR